MVRVRVVVEDFTHISLCDFAALPSDAGAWLVPLCADHPTPVMWGRLLCTKRCAVRARVGLQALQQLLAHVESDLGLPPEKPPSSRSSSSSKRAAWISLSSSQVQAGRAASGALWGPQPWLGDLRWVVLCIPGFPEERPRGA